MGRHSRGAGSPPQPLPDPPARHPYAPRPMEDTGVRDRLAHRVVDVGLPPSAPEPGAGAASAVAFPIGGGADLPPPGDRRPTDQSALRPVPGFGPEPSRFGAMDTAPPGDPEPPGYGATRADLAGPRSGPSRYADPEPPGYGATRADLAGPRSDPSRYADPEPRRRRSGAPAEPPERWTAAEAQPPRRRSGTDRDESPAPARHPAGGRAALREEPARVGRVPDGGLPAPEPPARFGATRADLAEQAGRLGVTRAELAESAGRFGATRADQPEAWRRADRYDSGEVGRNAGADLDEAPEPARFGAADRFGATRADLVESLGSAALAPRAAQDPDEVTDTGARRARSAFRLATGADEADDQPEEPADDDREPSLLLQWCVFVGQTLTGAVAGLGIWLGFYRLWSTWPFYAVPAVGLTAIVLLVLARTLRRRHGRDIDLLTAVVTVGVVTLLTVLPAAFTLQRLAS